MPALVTLSAVPVPVAPVIPTLRALPVMPALEPEVSNLTRSPVREADEVATLRPVPEVRALVERAIPVPVVRELALTAMVVARVVETSSIWKALPAVVRIPLKLYLTRPLVGVAVELVVTESALPVRPVEVEDIANPLPLVRAAV